MSDKVADLSAYRRGADRVRDALREALGRPLSTGARRAMLAGRQYDPYEPGGDIWRDRLAAHDGREFQGGAVCWNPDELCEGICRTCPTEAS